MVPDSFSRWIASGFARLRPYRHIAYSVGVIALASIVTFVGASITWIQPETVPPGGLAVNTFASVGGFSEVTIVALVSLAVLSALHLIRHRMPVLAISGAAVVLVAENFLTGATAMGGLILAGDLLYEVTLRSRLPWLRAVSLAGSAFAVIGLLLLVLFQGVMPSSVVASLVLFIIVGTTLWWAETVRASRVIAEQQSARAETVGHLAEVEMRAALAEARTSISRDLHDTVSGQLSAISLRAEAVLVDPALSEVSRNNVSAIRHSSVAALGEMRSLIEVLRRGDGAGDRVLVGSLAHIPELVIRAKRAGHPVSLTMPDAAALSKIPAEVSVAAYRIVQEALANAAKHANPTAGLATVIIIREHSDLIVSVTNSCAPSPADSQEDSPADSPADSLTANRGHGLVGLRERAEMLGGSLSAERVASTWLLHCSLPLTPKGIE